MKPQYRPITLGQKLGYLVEECGEVLAAVGKTQRWGLESFNPEPGASPRDKPGMDTARIERSGNRVRNRPGRACSEMIYRSYNRRREAVLNTAAAAIVIFAVSLYRGDGRGRRAFCLEVLVRV